MRQPLFRLHTEAHPAPRMIRVFVLAWWATICIFIGIIPAGHLVAAVVVHITVAQAYAITAGSIGLLGLVLIMSAFASIHRPVLPWAMMTIATSLLMVNVAMVYVVPL